MKKENLRIGVPLASQRSRSRVEVVVSIMDPSPYAAFDADAKPSARPWKIATAMCGAIALGLSGAVLGLANERKLMQRMGASTVLGSYMADALTSMYDFEFEATTLGGERVALKAFKGKPLLVMNVATL